MTEDKGKFGWEGKDTAIPTQTTEQCTQCWRGEARRGRQLAVEEVLCFMEAFVGANRLHTTYMRLVVAARGTAALDRVQAGIVEAAAAFGPHRAKAGDASLQATAAGR